MKGEDIWSDSLNCSACNRFPNLLACLSGKKIRKESEEKKVKKEVKNGRA